MPNHITNRLIIKSDEQTIKKVLAFLKGEPYDNGSPRFMDFNKITPIPDELIMDSSSLGEDGMYYLMAKQKRFTHSSQDIEAIKRFDRLGEDMQEKALKLGRQHLHNIANHGFKDWYDWRIHNWGTKWNAYDQSFEEPNILWFNTAWSGVVELIHKLSEKFPNVEFDYSYADEDTGCNTGRGIIKNGVSEVHSLPSQSNEAYELAFELRPDKKEYYELTDGGYKYKEED